MKHTPERRTTFSSTAAAVMVLLVTGGVLRAQSTTATMSGIVTDVNNNPIDSIVVMYTLGPNLQSNGLPPSGGMLAGTDGTFSFSNLAPGLYYLCAYAPPQKSVLDSCEWTFSPPTVTLTTGQNQTGVQIVLQPGVRLQLRVNDLAQVLPVPVLGRKGNALQTSLTDAGGFYHAMPLRSFDATGFNYEMVVPAAMALTMQFGGTGLALTDAKGVAVPFRAPATPAIQIPAKSAPTLLTFSVGPATITTTPSPTPSP